MTMSKKHMFPMTVKRALRLTSPLMHGTDVIDVQHAINIWAGKHDTPRVKRDGLYGKASVHGFATAAYSMGLKTRSATKPNILLMYHPWMRNPFQRRRARKRAKEAQSAGKGLAAILRHAHRFVGVHESPAGSNRGTPNPSGWQKNFGIDGAPWCGAFYGSMVLAAGGHVTDRVVYCPYNVIDAKAHQNGWREWIPRGEEARVPPGAAILYDWNGDGVADHIGAVRGFSQGFVNTIEGNTSMQGDPTGSQSDGGIVALRMRPLNSMVMGYAVPAFG